MWSLRDRDSQYQSFLLIDRLLGSVEVPLDDADNPDVLVPILEGNVAADREEHLRSLERRELLRRKRFLKRKFAEAFEQPAE